MQWGHHGSKLKSSWDCLHAPGFLAATRPERLRPGQLVLEGRLHDAAAAEQTAPHEGFLQLCVCLSLP